MDLFYILLIIYLVFINIISICITIYDKVRAIHGKWRVQESTLLLFALLGGSVSMYATMQIVRHKTRRLKFMLGIPAIIICQILLVYFVWSVIINGQ